MSWSRRELLWLAAAVAPSGAQPGRPPITGLSEVVYESSDLKAAQAFYGGYLGLGRAAHHAFAVNRRQTVRLVRERRPRTDRLVEIVWETPDPAGMARYLQSQGTTVIVERHRVATQDPDGHTVVFAVPRRGGAPREAIAPRMSHTGILVGRLERAMHFYRDVLGFAETWRGSRDGKVLNWVNLRVPDGEDYLEFMLYDEMPAPDRRGSQHHICLEVPDMDAAKRTLAARTGYSRPLEARTGINRRRQLNLFDADGTRVELMEPRTVDGTPAVSSQAAPPH